MSSPGSEVPLEVRKNLNYEISQVVGSGYWVLGPGYLHRRPKVHVGEHARLFADVVLVPTIALVKLERSASLRTIWTQYWF